MPILALKFNFLTNTSYCFKEKFKVFIATNRQNKAYYHYGYSLET